MSMCRVLCWKRVFAMSSVFSWQDSLGLCPASFCTPRPNLPVTTDITWLPSFAFQSPVMRRTSFMGVSSRKSCRSSQNYSISAYSALLVGTSTCITLIVNGLPWKQRSFCRFWDCTQELHFRLFCWYEGYSISPRGFLPTVIDIMVIWIKFKHSYPF